MINEIDIKGLWRELDVYERELEKETRALQDVWVKISQVKTKNDSEAHK